MDILLWLCLGMLTAMVWDNWRELKHINKMCKENKEYIEKQKETNNG